jgi:FMN reductase
MAHHRPNIVAVTGGLWSPSKTTSLTTTIADAVAEKTSGIVHLVELGPIAQEIGTSLTRDAAPPALSSALARVENADILIAATPVFRGTFSGHFKHFFDLIAIDSLREKPVVVAASGGGDRHCLVIEYSLRPLFGFFQAFTVPTGVYASESDFTNGHVVNPIVLARIASAANEVASLTRTRIYPRQETVQQSPSTASP